MDSVELSDCTDANPSINNLAY